MSKCLLAALVILATFPSLAEQIKAGPHRPGNVPEDYVVTPFGYFHPSCVQSVAEGDAVLLDGRVQHSDGRITGKAGCDHPRYASDGTPRAARVRPLVPEISGWLENANVAAPAGQSYSALYAETIVPPQPERNDGQILFFFPGLEDINETESILQPVLTWAGGQWTISNWNCCLSGITVQSTPANVSPGDTIYSSITENCSPGTIVCATWTMFSIDTRTLKNTLLENTPSEGQTFNWAFGGVAEPYYVVNCQDYPRDGEEMNRVVVYDETFESTSPNWSVSGNTTGTPQCGYKVSTSPYQVTLDF
jgi:hypothetical protein